MKEHNGMRPQDIVILLKIISLRDNNWLLKDLSKHLHISGSEVSESLNRSLIGGLIEADKHTVRKEELLEFLVYGLKHVYPAVEGHVSRGLPTGHSAPILKDEFVVDDLYVWPARGFSAKGITVKPLYSTVPEACKEDQTLYDLLALVDALRLGKRDKVVVELLAKKIYSPV